MGIRSLWLANPYIASNVIGETNGAYWGNQADEHDKKIKDSVLAFLHPEQISQEAPIISPIDTNTQDIFSSVFKDEYEVVKIEVDPLAYFLATNPNYEVIAHNITELWDSHVYRRTPIPGGTAFWNPDLPYLKNATYLALYTDGEYHYHQPHGEVRGITFPFMYDKTTGTPLTMPIKDAIGHYDHTSTIDTLYTNPEAFNTPSHVNWYNPYWNYAVHQAKVDALNHYLKSITVDKFMNAITAPFGKSVHYDSSSAKLVTNDILYDKSGNIDFSHLPDLRENVSSYGPMITSMELANGILFEMNNHGDFVCSNCNSVDVALLENAANVMLHHI